MAETEREHPLYKKIKWWNERIDQWKADDQYFYFKTFDGIDGPRMTCDGRPVITYSSYSYLDLLNHPRVLEASKKAIDRYGSACVASYVLGGGYDLHQRLVDKICEFSGREDALLYISGFMTNLATVTSLVGKGEWVISDASNHASLMEGCQRSGGIFRPYRHNDMNGLEKLLQRAHEESGGSLVVCDAVFSMDGDILDLPTVSALCKKYNALLMADEAHSIGVLGANGRGIEEHFGMPGAIDIKMGTLSKVIPAAGGYIAGSSELINFLRFGAKGYLFSGAMPPGTAAAALEGFRVVEEEGAERKRELYERLVYFKKKMTERGFVTDSGPTPAHITDNLTPIIPVMIYNEGKAMDMTRICFDAGIFIPAIAYPGVSKGTERLRVTLTAGHTYRELDEAVDIITMAAKKVGLELPMRNPADLHDERLSA